MDAVKIQLRFQEDACQDVLHEQVSGNERRARLNI